MPLFHDIVGVLKHGMKGFNPTPDPRNPDLASPNEIKD